MERAWVTQRGRKISLLYVLWFNFILGLNFIFFCFKLIIIYYHTQKQKKIKFKPRIKLKHNIYKPTVMYASIYAYVVVQFILGLNFIFFCFWVW